MTLAITQLGQPVLRKKAKPVAKPASRRTLLLIRQMLKSMREADGVGIAAPQVGKSLRIFIVAPQPNTRYPHAPSIPPIAMINPVLKSHSKNRIVDWEGCLSIPGIRGRVPRYKRIEIEFTLPSGERRSAVLTNFIARIFQHELDHINGMVFLDRVEDTRTLMTEAQYRKRLER